MSMYIIRKYNPQDADAIWTLHKVTMAKNNINLPDGRYADLRDINNAYVQSNGLFLVAAADDGQLIGMGGARCIKSGLTEISHLRVHPGHQNKKVGAQILTQLEQFARDKNCPVTQLSVLLNQTDAQRFFLQQGYYFLRRTVLDEMDVVFFEKRLDWQKDSSS